MTGDIDQCRIHEFPSHEQMEFAAEIAELSRDQIEGIFWANPAAALCFGEDEAAANG